MSRPALAGTLVACALVVATFAAAALWTTRGFEAWTYEALRADDAHRGRLAAPPTHVRSATGRRLALWTANDDGAVYLLDFVYTSCPSVCQALGSEFTRLQAELAATRGPARRVRLLSLSFDVDRDGPAELAAYARRHQADESRWTVAVPETRAEAARLLAQLGVVALADGAGGYVHNGDIHVVDGRGVVRAIYAYPQWREALGAARRLAGGMS